MERGQSSAELLIILGVSLVALTAIFSFSQQSISDLNKRQLVDTAQASITSLRDAVNDVYAQGAGARKKVFFSVPGGTDASLSGIQGNTLVLHVLGSDVQAKTSASLSGAIPVEIGGHEVWVTAHEGYVAIGVENISVDRTSIFVTLAPGSGVTEGLTISNSSGETASITIQKNWPHTDVTLALDTQSFSLTDGGQQSVSLDFAANDSAAWNYSGSLAIGASFGTLPDENILVPVNAEVSAVSTGENLIILPLSLSNTLNAGESYSDVFQACNNSDSTLNNISFSASGEIASWVEPIPDIGSLAAGSCQSVGFTINVPQEQAGGTYTGAITATDASGAGSNSDSISITLEVTSAEPSEPKLGNVDVVFFSDAGYTSHTLIYLQGDVVYYEVRTFDVNGSIIEVTDMNTTLTDPNLTVQQALTGLSTTGGVYRGSYSLAVSADTGTWTLDADANRNSTVSDSNAFTVTAFSECSTQAACFSQAWNSSSFTCVSAGNPNGRYCQLSESAPFWTIQNTSSETTLTITRARVSWTGDTDGAPTVDTIVLNGVQRNSAASANGEWNDITDFSLAPGEAFSADNWLRWSGSAESGRMDNETETYTLEFEFSDASIYTIVAYNPA